MDRYQATIDCGICETDKFRKDITSLLPEFEQLIEFRVCADKTDVTSFSALMSKGENDKEWILSVSNSNAYTLDGDNEDKTIVINGKHIFLLLKYMK